MRREALWPFKTPYPVTRQVIVNLKTGTAFRGVAWERKGEYLVLRKAEIVGKAKAVPVDGEVAIPIVDIEFVQVF